MDKANLTFGFLEIGEKVESPAAGSAQSNRKAGKNLRIEP